MKKTYIQSHKTEKLPITTLLSFLGTGKNTLLHNILNNPEGKRVAVISNDMSEININATLVRDKSVLLSYTEKKLVKMANICIYCTRREERLKKIGKLNENRRFDYLLIASTGISKPVSVVATFNFVGIGNNSIMEVNNDV